MRVPAHDRPLQHQIRAGQARTGCEQQAQQRAGDAVRRTRNDPEGPVWQAKLGRIGAHHCHGRASETLPQAAYPVWMQLHREYSGTGLDQMYRQRTGPGAYIEYQLPGVYPGIGDDARRPGVNERMPSPGPPRPYRGGHDAP